MTIIWLAQPFRHCAELLPRTDICTHPFIHAVCVLLPCVCFTCPIPTGVRRYKLQFVPGDLGRVVTVLIPEAQATSFVIGGGGGIPASWALTPGTVLSDVRLAVRLHRGFAVFPAQW